MKKYSYFNFPPVAKCTEHTLVTKAHFLTHTFLHESALSGKDDTKIPSRLGISKTGGNLIYAFIA